MASGNPSYGKGADAALVLGLGAAAGAAVTGITDYQHLTGYPRRVGILHGLLNTIGIVFYISSMAARQKRNRRVGWGFALLGFATSAAAAYLGGELVFDQKVGVNHAPEADQPEKYTAVISFDDLPEGELHRVDVDNTPILLVRQGRRVYALAETCSHLGGPLSEGELKEDNSVICPWHGSHFSLEDGSLLAGPSTYPQPCYDARVRDGQIEIRARK
jgi:nitrite reductase/ring-hydroxylating ferredoxin subunit